ncbi:MAG: aldo/keto reductase [Candidatus Poseidoniales archaeon]|jgi:diketogulonate reductase-like aldo/keto reductase|nr:aldo/keto reductase [Candidatus Poseidoniales archaeon]|tara:strand:- start:227 stop:1075 length:849 start_codon:yes stop_codon:yes gene_type:complete
MVDHVTIGHRDNKNGSKHFEIVMPRFGLGVWQMDKEACKSSIRHALNQGYRLIDTATAYGNEEAVGEAIRDSNIPRNEIFVVTKLRRVHATGYDETLQRCRESLARLNLDYVDLYLVHAPPEDISARGEVWRAMEECVKIGLTRSIGVSNYGKSHLEAMRDYATILPAVNQIEIHPWLQRPELRKATIDIGAIPMGYSPLARGQKVNDSGILKIAESVGCTSAQAAIKWVYDTGSITIPKSSNHGRITENLESLNFDISDFNDDFSSLEESYVSGWDPTTEP